MFKNKYLKLRKKEKKVRKLFTILRKNKKNKEEIRKNFKAK